MFLVLPDQTGQATVITDNTVLAEQIRLEGGFPVYFTRGPSMGVADGLMSGAAAMFGGSWRIDNHDENGTFSAVLVCAGF